MKVEVWARGIRIRDFGPDGRKEAGGWRLVPCCHPQGPECRVDARLVLATERLLGHLTGLPQVCGAPAA